MIIQLKDGANISTYPGANIIFHKDGIHLGYLDTSRSPRIVKIADIVQIEGN